MSITKTAVIACALVATTAIGTAEATAPTYTGDVVVSKGAKQITPKVSSRSELLGQAPPAMLHPLQTNAADVHGRRQGPPMPGLSFFTACRAAVRKCLVVAPRSVLSCVFSMPPSDGAMTSDCSAWIARRDRTTAPLKEEESSDVFTKKEGETAGSRKGVNAPKQAAFADRARKAGSTNEVHAGHPGAQAVHHQVEFEV